MKIAAVITGQVRTMDQCAASLHKHILDPLREQAQVDVFLAVASDGDAHKAYECFPAAEISVDDQPLLDEKNYILRSGCGVCGIQSVLRQFWVWRRGWELVKAAEKERGSYDMALRLRTDSLYYNRIEPVASWQPKLCYVPRFSSFWGVCDRFAYGERDVIERWHTVFDRLDTAIANGRPFHPESMVMRDIYDAGFSFSRTGVLFSTVRTDGNLRPPEFMTSIGDVPAP
jgi:hypothetical protein